jgi:tetratricopeptide (TPR) repeat protein
MNIRTRIIAWPGAAAVIVSLALAGCDFRATRAQAAYNEYQATSAAGDLRASRIALIKLVAIQEDVSAYWVELGKVNIQLRAYGDAYYAFTRAYELDRDDPTILHYLMELALRGGSLDAAEERARELELIEPGDAGVKLTYGFVELRRGNLQLAERYADEILVGSPFDGAGKLLKSLVLLRTGNIDEAITLLKGQLQAQPGDRAALQGLAGLYERLEDWKHLTQIHQRRMLLTPGEPEVAVQFIETAFKAGDINQARTVSRSLLLHAPKVETLKSVLDVWAHFWPGSDRIGETIRIASLAPPGRRPVYAAFLNRVGSPRAAAALVKSNATLPVNLGNADANAAMAESLGLAGQAREAKNRFDLILAVDDHQTEALRGRAELALRTGNALAAVNDAQQLVSVTPASSGARLLLYRAYLKLGDRSSAERTLWDAFHAVEADQDIYHELHAYIAQQGDGDRVRQIDKEFDEQREAKLTREFI